MQFTLKKDRNPDHESILQPAIGIEEVEENKENRLN